MGREIAGAAGPWRFPWCFYGDRNFDNALIELRDIL